MKISHTIASAWYRGDKDLAINMLNGNYGDFDLARERAFAYGKGAHRAWELETKETGKLPAIFKMPQFKVIDNEIKLHKQLNENDWLVGVIDCLAIGEVYGAKMFALIDYKAGGTSDKWQCPVYHYLSYKHEKLLELYPDFDPSHFMYLTMNKITGETKTDIIKLTYPKTVDEWNLPDATTYTQGYNFLLTVLSEIKAELEIV